MKTYRVFVTRHYIAVEWFDIKAKSPAKAKRLAKAAAYKVAYDARQDATDNGWIPDEPVVVKRPGAYAGGTLKMQSIPTRNKPAKVYKEA
jgi:hypothetical protein